MPTETSIGKRSERALHFLIDRIHYRQIKASIGARDRREAGAFLAHNHRVAYAANQGPDAGYYVENDSEAKDTALPTDQAAAGRDQRTRAYPSRVESGGFPKVGG